MRLTGCYIDPAPEAPKNSLWEILCLASKGLTHTYAFAKEVWEKTVQLLQRHQLQLEFDEIRYFG